MTGNQRIRITLILALGLAAIGAVLVMSFFRGTTSQVFETTAPRLGSSAGGNLHRDGAAPELMPKGALILDK